MYGEKIISKHEFFFPFYWDFKSTTKGYLFNQHKLMEHPYIQGLPSWKMQEHKIITDKVYNERVYFYRPVQDVLYPKPGSNMVKNYEKNNKSEEDLLILESMNKTYTLKLRHVELKMYKTGIGLLSFTLYNSEYHSPEDIMAINSLSKCVYPYRLPLDEAQKDLFPKRIEICLGTEKVIERFELDYKKDLYSISKILMFLLGPAFTSGQVQKTDYAIHIEPLMSNRMFALCLYQNNDFLQQIKNKSITQPFLSRFMIFSQKEKAFDMEYIELPKVIYGIGRFSMIGITTTEETLHLYNQLVTLALVQRASLLNFSNKMAFISTLPKGELVPAIQSIYEIYIQFITQMYFQEITVDVQGTGIYNRLVSQLELESELKQLDFEMKEVHEYAILVEKNQAKLKVELLTIVGAALVIPTFVTGFFGMNIMEDLFMNWWEQKTIMLWLNSYVLLPILLVLLIYTWSTYKNRANRLKIVMVCSALCISVGIVICFGCGLGK